jgi:hypothetical protein
VTKGIRLTELPDRSRGRAQIRHKSPRADRAVDLERRREIMSDKGNGGRPRFCAGVGTTETRSRSSAQNCSFSLVCKRASSASR